MLLTELGTFSKDYETRTLTALIFFKTKCGTKMTQAKWKTVVEKDALFQRLIKEFELVAVLRRTRALRFCQGDFVLHLAV